MDCAPAFRTTTTRQGRRPAPSPRRRLLCQPSPPRDGYPDGCMHSWICLEAYPDFMDSAMPLACLPVQIAGRNRWWRKMASDAIRLSPDYKGSESTHQPCGLRTALNLL